ncbi:MAG: bifunctional 2-C-methyl-D-erythritol 4-phosphate cytidylyltransferase/2-C-methyl-D-erythritol 2,4-cyclodiphosphate synthase [Caulobacterales bacterium]
MKSAAVIVAAGGGTRAGGEIPKQYRNLGQTTMLTWSVSAFEHACVDPIIVVIDAAHRQFFDVLNLDARSVAGGASRTASVRAGLEALRQDGVDFVFIHDAARPGVSTKILTDLTAALEAGFAGAAPALPSADALKAITEEGAVTQDLNRAGLVRVQTPQAFRYSAIAEAYARAPASNTYEDDLAVARAAGYAVTTIAGDPRLMKATYPEDFAILERLLGETTSHTAGSVRVGNGVDAHRFGVGDHVTLCGIRIQHDKGLVGHSDADAGWHALTDAILGALAIGDIGDHFPPTDPQWRGADSAIFLAHAAKLAREAHARITHVDVTLLCEKPKIAPHREMMRARTAEVLSLPINCISIKATTTEKMGFLGREEGLAAQATATLMF